MCTGLIDVHSELGLSAIVVTINAGAIFEVPGLRGVSHLVEHVACEGTKPLLNTISRLCVEDNAVSGTDYVQFFIRGLTKNVDKVFEEWLNLLLTYVPTEAVFNQELAIVKQEYTDALSQPTTALYVNSMRKHFGHSPSIGVRADLENLDFDTFSRFYGQLVNDLRSILLVRGSGNSAVTGELYSKLATKNYRHAVPTFDPEVKDLPLEFSSSSANATIFDAIPGPSYAKPWELELIGHMLSDGLGSPVLKKLREELGYVYSASMAVQTHVGGPAGVLYLVTSTEPKNVDGVRAAMSDVVAPETLTSDRFNECIEQLGYKLEEQNIFKTQSGYLGSVTENQDAVLDLEKLAGVTHDRARDILESLRTTEVRRADFSDVLRVHGA